MLINQNKYSGGNHLLKTPRWFTFGALPSGFQGGPIRALFFVFLKIFAACYSNKHLSQCCVLADGEICFLMVVAMLNANYAQITKSK